MNKHWTYIFGLILFTNSVYAQQANINLEYNPQENTEGYTPFSAQVNSPEVHNDQTVTFRIKHPMRKKLNYLPVPFTLLLTKDVNLFPSQKVKMVSGH
ncbi:hypothetical protein [Marinilabilia salmonicolor]|uniref:hypothetical protein n=1 Tax=Marinilabilia salmonicolor TaxID=989 RepID=UPI0019025761|nr:hypothetical protein [Marinilabilia salmonicolor]